MNKTPQDQVFCHLRAADLETLDARAQAAILLWEDHFTVWDGGGGGRGGGENGRVTQVSILPEVTGITVRAVRQTENTESFVGELPTNFSCNITKIFILWGGWKRRHQPENYPEPLILLSHHDTAGQ